MKDNNIADPMNELEEFLGKELVNICFVLELHGKISDDKFPLLHSWIFEKGMKSKADLFVIYELFCKKTRKNIYCFLDERNCRAVFYDTDKYKIDSKSNELVDFVPYR